MAVARPLTPSQRAAVQLALKTSEGRLIRLPSGFWTYPGCALKPRGLAESTHGYDVPTEYVGVRTLEAAADKGAFAATKGAWPSVREYTLTQVGRLALQAGRAGR